MSEILVLYYSRNGKTAQLAFKGGHIGIYVSGRAQREVPPAIHTWLAKRAD